MRMLKPSLRKWKLPPIAPCSLLLAVTIMGGDLFLRPGTKNVGVPPQSSVVHESIEGQRIKVRGVQWDPKQPTLVTALATTCHFCFERTPFYHTLTERTRDHSAHARVVAMFA